MCDEETQKKEVIGMENVCYSTQLTFEQSSYTFVLKNIKLAEEQLD